MTFRVALMHSPRLQVAQMPQESIRQRLRADLLGQIDDAQRDHIKIAWFGFVRLSNGAVAVFVLAVDETSA
jgi:hypothetical protein